MIHQILIDQIPILAVLAILLACSAFFSGSETALFSLTRSDRRRLERSSNRTNRLILALLRDPQRLLASVLLGNMVVNVSFYSLSVFVSVRLAAASTTSAAGFGIASLLAVTLFGEVSPKGIAVGHPIGFARLVTPALYLYCGLVRPISAVLRRVSLAVTHLLSTHTTHLPYVTQEELQMLMGMAEQQGVMDRETCGMMEQVIEIGSIRVSEVMTPRVDTTMFDLASGREAFCALVKETHEERIPAYEGSMDNVLGVLVAREVFLRPEKEIRSLPRPVPFVPETQTVESLLRRFRETGGHMAVVVDEYGGTSGLVTMEHLMEEVVGNIRDEFEVEETPVEELDADTYLLAGDLSTRDWRHLLGVGFDPPGIETVAGFVIHLLGRIPREGDFVEWRGLRFGVERMSGRRVVRVRVQRIRDEEAN